MDNYYSMDNSDDEFENYIINKNATLWRINMNPENQNSNSELLDCAERNKTTGDCITYNSIMSKNETELKKWI